ncbi:hypothetical protein NPIL_16511 [Nephila pilipes]|uniref:Uncharacterized protein n=1 Tax=Nephila pilipes TaxID=299642 RepID=A0A8X6MUW6_NEPPI|nr:hypothetical protein NPIL_16511 [Nephila pilipes]
MQTKKFALDKGAGSITKGNASIERRYPALVRGLLSSPYGVGSSALSRWAMKSILYRWKPIVMQRVHRKDRLHTKSESKRTPSRTEKRNFYRGSRQSSMCIERSRLSTPKVKASRTPSRTEKRNFFTGGSRQSSMCASKGGTLPMPRGSTSLSERDRQPNKGNSRVYSEYGGNAEKKTKDGVHIK